jgi:hypothetical protein
MQRTKGIAQWRLHSTLNMLAMHTEKIHKLGQFRAFNYFFNALSYRYSTAKSAQSGCLGLLPTVNLTMLATV